MGRARRLYWSPYPLWAAPGRGEEVSAVRRRYGQTPGGGQTALSRSRVCQRGGRGVGVAPWTHVRAWGAIPAGRSEKGGDQYQDYPARYGGLSRPDRKGGLSG